jgi:hypothetical protein
MKTKRKILNAIKDAIRKPYEWPGGYDKFAIMNDGGTLCAACIKKEYKQIMHDTKNEWRTGWDVAAIDATCNHDDAMTCDNCGKEIIEA